VGTKGYVERDDLPVASRADERPSPEARLPFRAALFILVTTLASLIMGRGYGLESLAVPASGETIRKTNGEWESIPWQLAGTRSPDVLQLAVDGSACARVVSYEVAETPDAVHVTVWRRTHHPSCAPLSVVVKLRAPLGERALLDGGVIVVG
jgi:hypothetical protein